MRLQVGDIIRVDGFVMLAKLDEGRYRVKSISKYHGQDTYTFSKPRGKKSICRFYVHQIDPFLRTADCSDLNKIVKE